MTEPVEFELMRPAQIVEARRRCPVVYLPLGPLEWHGPHLPMGTDALHARLLALEVARRLGGVVLPPFYLGTETVRPAEGAQSLAALGFGAAERIVGMDFPHNSVKSLYVEEGTFAVAVREIIRLLKLEPYRVIVLLNGHGAVGQQRTLRRLAAEESDPPRVWVVYETTGGRATSADADPGHAGRGETAFLLSALPHTVDVGALPPPGTPLRYPDYGIANGAAFEGRPTPDFTVPEGSDPRAATAEEGAAMLNREIARLVQEVTVYLELADGSQR